MPYIFSLLLVKLSKSEQVLWFQEMLVFICHKIIIKTTHHDGDQISLSIRVKNCMREHNIRERERVRERERERERRAHSSEVKLNIKFFW